MIGKSHFFRVEHISSSGGRSSRLEKTRNNGCPTRIRTYRKTPKTKGKNSHRTQKRISEIKDPELVRVLLAWESLPSPLKKAISQIISSVKTSSPKRGDSLQ